MKKSIQETFFNVLVWLEGNEKDVLDVKHLLRKTFLSKYQSGLSNDFVTTTNKLPPKEASWKR